MMSSISSAAMRRHFTQAVASCCIAFTMALQAFSAPKDLSASVSLKDPMACKGARRLNITVELRNNGKEALVVPLSGVGYAYFYLPEPKVKSGQARANVGFSGMTPLGPENLVTIGPGESHRFDANIQFPRDVPATTTQMEFFVIFLAEPPEKKPKGKMFKGEVQSQKIKFDYADCSAATP